MGKVARPLGRYHVLDRIAFGGMAEIFRAITFDDEGRSHLVAIKQVLPHYAEDREFIDMLVDEARLVSMLHHKNIVEIYEVGHVDEVYFVAMEYVWGKDLRSVLERCRSRGMNVPFEVTSYVMCEALAGLDTAHRLLDPRGQPAGLVHRDFSPSNILISYSGDVKICDFGIAKATFSRIETKTGVIKGKVKYMSPEQAFGRKLDHRSDLFSAGSVLYEMLTNEPPFKAKNEIDLIFLVRDAQIIPPTKRLNSIPSPIEDAVFKSMARARSARYQSAAEFRHNLAHYLRNRGIGNWKAELGRFMHSLYSREIKRERASLAEYTLDQTAAGQNLGHNLIADALGHDAAYTKFNPFPTKAQVPAEGEAGSAQIHEESTRIIESPTEAAEQGQSEDDTDMLPISLEEQSTMIFDLPEEMAETEGPTNFYSRVEDSPPPQEDASPPPTINPTSIPPPPPAGPPRSAASPPIPPPPPPPINPQAVSSSPPGESGNKPTRPAPPPVPAKGANTYRPPPPPPLSSSAPPKAPAPKPPRVPPPVSSQPQSDDKQRFGGHLDESAFSTLPRQDHHGEPPTERSERQLPQISGSGNTEHERTIVATRSGTDSGPGGREQLDSGIVRQDSPDIIAEEDLKTQVASTSTPQAHDDDTKPTRISTPDGSDIADERRVADSNRRK